MGVAEAMANSTIRAVLDDGPHAGEEIEVDTGPEGSPPHQIVLSHPLGADTDSKTTTYHLHPQADPAEVHTYRTGCPGQDTESASSGRTGIGGGGEPSTGAGKPPAEQRWESEGGA